jgi:tetratricopeptide (TPR) repeat protein
MKNKVCLFVSSYLLCYMKKYFFLLLFVGFMLVIQSCATVVSYGINAANAARNTKVLQMLEFEKLAQLNLKAGNYQEANKEFWSANTIAGSLNEKTHIAYTYYSIAVTRMVLDSMRLVRYTFQDAVNVDKGGFTETGRQARKLAERLDSLSKLPPSATTFYEMGKIKFGFALYNKAVDDYSRSLDIDKSSDSLYVARANAVIYIVDNSASNIVLPSMQANAVVMDSAKRSGLLRSAISDCNEALKRNPSNTLALINRAVLYARLGDLTAAADDYTALLKITPQSGDAYSRRSSTYATLKQYDKALNDLTQAIEIDSNETNIYLLRRAYIKKEMKDYKAAITDIDRILQRLPSADMYYQRGLFNLNTQNFAAAKDDFRSAFKAAQLESANSERYDGLAAIIETITNTSKEIQQNPKDFYQFVQRGQSYFRLGEYSLALADLSQAITLNPKNAEAYNIRGLVKHQQEEYKAAVEDFTASLAVKEDGNVYTHRYLSRQMLGQKDLVCRDLQSMKKFGNPNADAMIGVYCNDTK